MGLEAQYGRTYRTRGDGGKMSRMVSGEAGAAVHGETPGAAGRNRIAVIAACVLAVVLAVTFARQIAEPFGHGHDGTNGKVWTSAARGFADDPIGSKLGAIHDGGAVYTNHPPLIIWETAAAREVFGDRRWADRMPAWAGTIAAIMLLDRVMRRHELSAVARSVGLLVGFATPMVLTFGTMLDTPVTSLPVAVWCLLAWQRDRDGDAANWERPLSIVLAVLAGWQAALLAGLTVIHPRGRSRDAVAAMLTGIGLLALWHLWVHGGLGDLTSTFGERAGTQEWAHPMSPWQAVRAQVDWLGELFTPLPLAIGAFGMWLTRRDPVSQVIAACVLVFPAVTSNALGFHSFWLYWLVLPVAIGSAWVADRPTRVRSRFARRS